MYDLIRQVAVIVRLAGCNLYQHYGGDRGRWGQIGSAAVGDSEDNCHNEVCQEAQGRASQQENAPANLHQHENPQCQPCVAGKQRILLRHAPAAQGMACWGEIRGSSM